VTTGLRGRLLRRRHQQSRALVLCYHRVGEVGTDPWSLCVSPENFAHHLAALSRKGRPGRLGDVVAWLGGAEDALAHGLTFVITFDDGYAESFRNAMPLLDEYEIPATAFLVSAHLGVDGEFWWDALERMLLHPGTLPPTLRLRVDDREHHWTLGKGARYDIEAHRRFRAWSAESREDPTERQLLFRSLYALLRTAASDERARVIAELAAWSGCEVQARPSHRVLTPAEARELAGGDLVEIGCHTRIHPLLSERPEQEQREELIVSKAELEAVVCADVREFAYPHGDYSEATVAIARATGFNCACTTAGNLVERTSDAFELPRVAVPDCDAETFERRVLAPLLA
jgi:peptidoglycan/xylan/chitin deacetylase (PgdA/CDA1 family)